MEETLQQAQDGRLAFLGAIAEEEVRCESGRVKKADYIHAAMNDKMQSDIKQ